jgi:exonuclease III
MRLLAWNVNHRTFKKAIPPQMPVAILSLKPDVVILTEYVPNGHERLYKALADAGLKHQHISSSPPKQNQVLIATRAPSERGDLQADESLPHANSNFLHVRLPGGRAEIVGIRVPMYKKSIERRTYWDWFESVALGWRSRPLMILGDLNADPDGTRHCGDPYLRSLRAAGWQIPTADGDWSFRPRSGAGTRLDHAIVSSAFEVRSAKYVVADGGHIYCGGHKEALSDHAVLVVDLVRKTDDNPSGN